MKKIGFLVVVLLLAITLMVVGWKLQSTLHLMRISGTRSISYMFMMKIFQMNQLRIQKIQKGQKAREQLSITLMLMVA